MTFPAADDRRWLDAATRQGAPFVGATGDQPTVAAIVVEPASQRLLGRAVTGPGGRPAALAVAIEEAGEATRGATLYVTLAPRGPEIDAVLAAGFARIVIGADEEGVDRLRHAGIVAVVADHEPSRRLHEGHFTRVTRNRPFVIAKLAVSTDGMVGRADRHETPVIGRLAQRWTEMQRAAADAVLMGWGAARTEPRLDVRLKGLEHRQPWRVIVAGLRTYNSSINLFAGVAAQPIAIVAIPEKKIEPPTGVELLRVKALNGRPDMTATLTVLAGRGVQTLLVETGPALLETLLAAGLVDRFHLLRSETEAGPDGIPAAGRGGIEARLGAAGLSLVDHRLLGADNLRTFERVF